MASYLGGLWLGTPSSQPPRINIKAPSEAGSTKSRAESEKGSFTPSLAGNDSIYGSSYWNETDPEKLQEYWDRSKKKYEAAKALKAHSKKSDSLEVPSQKSSKSQLYTKTESFQPQNPAGSSLMQTPYSPFTDLPDISDFLGQSDEEQIIAMEAKIASLRKKRERDDLRVQELWEEAHRETTAGIGPKSETSALAYKTLEQAVEDERAIAAAKRAIGYAKIAVTKTLKSIEKTRITASISTAPTESLMMCATNC
jgi:hypothetical protein